MTLKPNGDRIKISARDAGCRPFAHLVADINYKTGMTMGSESISTTTGAPPTLKPLPISIDETGMEFTQNFVRYVAPTWHAAAIFCLSASTHISRIK